MKQALNLKKSHGSSFLIKVINHRFEKERKKIAGYGASAKGLIILKCSNIGKKLEYFVDDLPAKQGFYSPVDHTPVISRRDAEKKLPDYFVITAPNYSDIIIQEEIY